MSGAPQDGRRSGPPPGLTGPAFLSTAVCGSGVLTLALVGALVLGHGDPVPSRADGPAVQRPQAVVADGDRGPSLSTATPGVRPGGAEPNPGRDRRRLGGGDAVRRAAERPVRDAAEATGGEPREPAHDASRDAATTEPVPARNGTAGAGSDGAGRADGSAGAGSNPRYVPPVFTSPAVTPPVVEPTPPVVEPSPPVTSPTGPDEEPSPPAEAPTAPGTGPGTSGHRPHHRHAGTDPCPGDDDTVTDPEPGRSEPGRSEPGRSEFRGPEFRGSDSGEWEFRRSESRRSESRRSESRRSQSRRSESRRSQSRRSQSRRSEFRGGRRHGADERGASHDTSQDRAATHPGAWEPAPAGAAGEPHHASRSGRDGRPEGRQWHHGQDEQDAGPPGRSGDDRGGHDGWSGARHHRH